MRKRRYLFTGMAVVLLFTILFAAGYTTLQLEMLILCRQLQRKKTFREKGKKKRSIIKGKIFELEVDKPESVKDKNLTWSIKDSSIVTFAGKERHDDDIKLSTESRHNKKLLVEIQKPIKKLILRLQ